MAYWENGKISVRVQLTDADTAGIPVTGTLTIDEITGVVHIVVDGGQLDITSFPQPLKITTDISAVTPTQTATNVSNASVQIAAANANRKLLLIRNQHNSGRVYIKFGTPATTNDLLLDAGESYVFPDGKTYPGAITAISDNATNKPVHVLEWS